MTYLAATSMIVRLRRGHDVQPKWVDAVRAGLVGVCPAVEAELVRATASRADRDALPRMLHSLFAWHPMPDSAWRFVGNAQTALVDLGQHRGPSVVDLLVAATAAAWGLAVLHVDADFETIGRVLPIRTVRADKP